MEHGNAGGQAGPTLHLIRHGETDWNREGRLQGWTDIPPNATGISQARATAAALRGRPIGAVISSDLSRAHDTAAVIAEHAGLELVVETALRERRYGSAEGRPNEEQELEYGRPLSELWDDHDVSFDGGESRRQAYQRVGEFLGSLLASPPPSEIVLVSHGGTLRVARGFLEGLPADQSAQVEFRANGELVTIARCPCP
jgi:broad specificity phosphatase PhoE